MSLSNKLNITDVDLKGKRVLIRVSPGANHHPPRQHMEWLPTPSMGEATKGIRRRQLVA